MNNFPQNETSQEKVTSKVPQQKKQKLLHKKGLYTLEVVDSTQEYDAYEYDKETQTTTYYRYVYPEISDDDFLKLSYGKEVDLGIPKCTKTLHEGKKINNITQESKYKTETNRTSSQKRATIFYSSYTGPSIDAAGLRTIGLLFLVIGILGAIGCLVLAAINGSLLYIFDGIIVFISCLVTCLIFNTIANLSNKTDEIISYLMKEQKNKQ